LAGGDVGEENGLGRREAGDDAFLIVLGGVAEDIAVGVELAIEDVSVVAEVEAEGGDAVDAIEEAGGAGLLGALGFAGGDEHVPGEGVAEGDQIVNAVREGWRNEGFADDVVAEVFVEGLAIFVG
jgi:hypothetical protein